MPLEEYKDLVGTAAGIVTAAQFFAPVFICRKIIKQGNTENVDPTPFVGGFGMSILMLQHGLLLGETPMIAVNILAFVLNTVYSCVYYKYTNQKETLISSFLRTIVFVLVIISYAQIDSRISSQRAETIYGIIVTVLFFALIGAPLLEVKTIIAEKNAEKLPFPLILSGTCCTSLWLLYGIIINNVFMVIQNSIGCMLAGVQLFLCLKYSSSAKEKLEKAKKAE